MVTGAVHDVTMEESVSNHRSALSGWRFDRGEAVAVEVTHIQGRHVDNVVFLSLARKGASFLGAQRGRQHL